MSDGYGEHSPERVRARELAQRTTKDATEQVEQDSTDAPKQPDEVGADAGEDVRGQAPEPFDAAGYADLIRDRSRRTHRVGGDIPSSSLIGQVLAGGAVEQAALAAMATRHARAWRLAGAPIGRRWRSPR